jgi:flagellar basal body P-ring protein FlgI
MKRREALMLGGIVLLGGCMGPSIRSQSPEEINAAGSDTQLVGDLAVPFGLYPLTIESVGLVTGLPGTGSDPEPSSQRAALLDEMQTRGVQNPNQVLASPTTSLVLVRAFLRAGIQKGDHFDVEVRIPSRSETTSLRDGWLVETRLHELGVAGGQMRQGHLLALAEGAVLVDPGANLQDESDRVKLGRGRILGGGTCLKDRGLGLVLKPDEKSVRNSATIGTAVNRRFHLFENGVKEGVAKPKKDDYIEIKVHPRYKDNVERYMLVIRSLAMAESAAEQMARLKFLERQLLDPVSSATAALRLEAIGKQGIEVLRKGMNAKEPEVRFYSAEALAYLDESEAVAPLAEAARGEPAFRVYALSALSAMDDYAAYEALQNLLSTPSAETRYGAFRALWAMNANDPLVRGESLDGKFSYHLLNVGGPAMIHATRSYRPEIVLFGPEQRFATPLVLEAGKNILVNSQEEGRITISRFAVDAPDQKRVVSDKVDEVIRAVVELGGHYPDVVQLLQQAKSKKVLDGKFEIDAIPRGGRDYTRESIDDLPEGNAADAVSPETATPKSNFIPANPTPDLFGNKNSGEDGMRERKKTYDKNTTEAPKKSHPLRDGFGKLMGRSPGDG